MIKHTLEISERAARLSLSHGQLIIRLDDAERRFPCEDVGVLILQNPAISLSAAILNALLKSGAVVVISDEKHLPSGLLLPTISHTELVPRMMAQVEAGQPARKNAWKAIVMAKIKAQAQEVDPPAETALIRLSESVRSGDPDNHEAQAARIYWSSMFRERYELNDKRDPEGESFFNSALNYGYAIIRAAVARAIVAAGLNPALGVFHHRRNNPFCLADDIMEPLRPLVDRTVKEIIAESGASASELTSIHRRRLLELLSKPVSYGESDGPLMAVLPRYVNSFFRLLVRESTNLEVPTY
ncbi:type II CRISPR-associated endonuclease Cas1 [Akkermansiaceae bacterium]|nr:type II CRISPR-associated endonuclease Cas1 [Akkermansiaceae bacterium]